MNMPNVCHDAVAVDIKVLQLKCFRSQHNNIFTAAQHRFVLYQQTTLLHILSRALAKGKQFAMAINLPPCSTYTQSFDFRSIPVPEM